MEPLLTKIRKIQTIVLDHRLLFMMVMYYIFFDPGRGLSHDIQHSINRVGKMTSADSSNVVVKVDRIVTRSEEKIAGNRMIIFRCQSEIDGLLKLFELKYELSTCKWYLFKIE